VFVQSNDMTSI